MHILTYAQNKTLAFARKWQYLLLQEKCRVCQRSIHPYIANMDFRYYVPPAIYYIGSEQIVSDALCQLCLDRLTITNPIITAHNWAINEYKSTSLLIISASFFTDPLATLIYRLKYDGDVLLAKDFACLIYYAWQRANQKFFGQSKIFCLVPVPLHPKRLKQRGFNQSELIAWRLSKMLGVAMSTKKLVRIKHTRPQQELSKTERKSNIANAFQTTSTKAFINQHVILIDDVCTSGATLVECGQTVLAAGAASVCAMTIAATVQYQRL
jgi:ComF family protein